MLANPCEIHSAYLVEYLPGSVVAGPFETANVMDNLVNIFARVPMMIPY